MGCGIYLIENKINGKKYIGSSIEMDVRMMKHKYSLRRNYHSNIYLQNTYNKYGENVFNFTKLEFCEEKDLIKKENYYIYKYKTNELKSGYNLATVNEFRRNNYNNIVKIKNSKHNLKKNGNFSLFKCSNLENGTEKIFDNLVDASIYLKENGYTNGKLTSIRQKISECLRGIKVHNGTNNNGSIRKTAYNHKWFIIK